MRPSTSGKGIDCTNRSKVGSSAWALTARAASPIRKILQNLLIFFCLAQPLEFPSSFPLRVEGSFQPLGKISCRADTPVVQKENAWRFHLHVVVDSNDIDPRTA